MNTNRVFFPVHHFGLLSPASVVCVFFPPLKVPASSTRLTDNRSPVGRANLLGGVQKSAFNSAIFMFHLGSLWFVVLVFTININTPLRSSLPSTSRRCFFPSLMVLAPSTCLTDNRSPVGLLQSAGGCSKVCIQRCDLYVLMGEFMVCCTCIYK